MTVPELRRDAPVGVFDSGLGGLTVARAIREALPHEDLVYLGDTARVPYGTRSPETVIRYARTCASHLRARGVKLLVVACNTVSAVAIDMLRVELDVPVLGVIGPGARSGVIATQNARLGVIATAGTVASGAYVRAVSAEDTRVEVFAQPAPMLVPLAEEGWLEGIVPEKVAERYVAELADRDIGALVLGCTHYPLLGEVITGVVHRLCGPQVEVVDSARATADELTALLESRQLGAVRARPGELKLVVTDLPGRFTEVATRFLGADVGDLEVEAVDL